jgi:hypothetical protein
LFSSTLQELYTGGGNHQLQIHTKLRSRNYKCGKRCNKE